MPGGRPTKYRDDYPQLLLDYFNKTIDHDEVFPTKAGFAIHIDVGKDTLNEWSNCGKHPKFSVAYKKAEDYQEKNLVSNAITGKYNPAFSIFFAKNNLGYKDKTEHNHSFDGAKESLAAKLKLDRD